MDSTDGEESIPEVRHRSRRIVRGILAVALLLVLIAGGLFWRLTLGPITTHFGTSYLSALVADRLGDGRQVEIGVVGLGLTESMQPELLVRDISVVHPDDVSVSINSLSAVTSWSTLLGGARTLAAVRIDRLMMVLLGPEISLPPPDIAVESARRLITGLGFGYFEISTLTLRSEMPGTQPRDVLTNVSITGTAHDQKRFDFQAVTLGYQGTVSLGVDFVLPEKDGDSFGVSVRSRGLDLVDLANFAGRASSPAAGSVAVSSDISITPDGSVAQAHARLNLGPFDTPAGGDNDLLSEPIDLDLSWNADRQLIELRPSPIVFEKGHLLVLGEIRPPGQDALWHFDLGIRGTNLSGEGDRLNGRLAGTYDGTSGALNADTISLSSNGSTFTAAMRGADAGDQSYAVLSGILPKISVQTLKTLWPTSALPEVRTWIGDNIQGGTITDFKVDATMTGLGRSGAPLSTVTFSFGDAAFRPFDGAPLVQGASGHAKLEGGRFEIAVDKGWSDLGDGRRLTLANSTFTIPDVAAKVAQGMVHLSVSGTVPSALAMWERLPYAAQTNFHLDPQQAKGDVTAELDISFPLVNNVGSDEIAITGHIDLDGFSTGERIGGHLIRKGQLRIALTDRRARITGTAEIDGAGADVNLDIPLDGTGPVSSSVRLVLDAAMRRQLGLDFGDVLTGAVAVELTDSDAGSDKEARLVSVDLAKASINLPFAGFHKRVGQPGRLTFKLSGTAGSGYKVDDLAVRIGKASVDGRLEIGADGGLASLDLPKCNLGGDDKLAVTARRQGQELKVDVNGSQVDLRGLVADFMHRSSSAFAETSMPVTVTVALDSAHGNNGEDIRGVNLTLRLSQGRINAMSLSLQTSSGGATSATLTPDKKGRRLRVEAADVGASLRFLDIYGRVYGGRAIVDGLIDDRGQLRASVDGANWKVVEEPALARLSTASEKGPNSGLSTAALRRLSFNLSFLDGVLTIKEGYVRTETAGLTMNGDVDFNKSVLRLSGSYLPTSQIDRLLGSVPLLGWTLFAGGHAGLLGVSYRMTGAIGSPDVTVNPLSAVTPGIFRRLFEMK